ncbi:hypothetical protein [Methylomagnum sp.]
MTDEDFIIDLFCRVDDRMKEVPQHSQAALWPSEVVTLGLLFAIKGVAERAFHRWIGRNHRALFPRLPDRTRLFRRLKAHWEWTLRFLARPSLLGIVDGYGIELVHPIRRGRSAQQFGAAGISNHRWIAGAKWCVMVNHLGGITGWVWAPANAHDTWFHPLIDVFGDRTVPLSDTGFHSVEGDPAHLKVCRPRERNERMLIETVLSMLTVVCHTKKMRHRLAEYFQAHLGLMAAAFNLLVGWFGLTADEDDFVPLSIAEFGL